jgi:hypothetical protein
MKLNKFFSWTALVFLITLPFFTGCGEDRKMHSPNLDLPDSVTVTVEVPAGAAFDLAVSSDYREERDDLGNRFIVHNKEQKYSFTENFNQTFPLVDSSEVFPLVDPDERYFSVKLKCTALESESDEDTGSLRLIIKFNGEGNFDAGNRDRTFSTQPISIEPLWDSLNPDDIPGFFEVGRLISVRTIFSRYNGISKRETSGNVDE